MPELSTPPRSPSTCRQTASSACSSNGSAVLVTCTPPAVTVCVVAVPAAPAAWPTSAAGSTCAPLGECPASGRQKRPPLPGGRSWMCAAREPATALPAAPPLDVAADSHGASLPVCLRGRHHGHG